MNLNHDVGYVFGQVVTCLCGEHFLGAFAFKRHLNDVDSEQE
jgi:hypothetical protein